MSKHDYKGAGDRDGNGLFASEHPSWEHESHLQESLEGKFGGHANPQLGTVTSPPSTSLGE